MSLKIKSNLLVKFKVIFIWVIGFSFGTVGQTNTNVSARSIALASCVATLKDMSVIQMNPSVLTDVKCLQIGLQNMSMTAMMDVQKNGAMVALPIQKGVLGISLQTFGNKVYRLFSGGVAYAMNISENLKLGVFLGDKNSSIQQYGSRNFIDVSLAIQGKLTDKITYGMCVQSLGVKSLEIQEANPTFLFVGIQYTSSKPNWRIYTEIEKSVISPVRLKIACEYFVSPSFIFRTGLMTSSYQVSSGIGVWFKKRVRIDIGSSWQPVLGLATQIGVNFSSKSKEKNEE